MRRTAAGVLVTALLTLGTAGTAHAAIDRDCPDFTTRADAQAALEAAPGDPERLDADGDGLACEDHVYAAAPATGTTTGTQVTTRPAGAVAAGDGSAAEDGSVLPVVLGGVALAAAGGAAVAARRSPRTSG
ncbi:Excalibur calcium-binding domain-containing protein [Geodermatophilus pulveris]|uniref:Excalibur calcium-binding domain-containing protein n=1 Tax=Geodermatophilus pulveris TaxID=1564159 RepID=A0A239HCG6_9ACTN|nr:excalibur calcium-binding domain-containing protein [Geodermatophilus pulveris]SNS78718.1 Excalibur calcium-binding domain-containing protein [Geodermatophilus pulveris]